MVQTLNIVWDINPTIIQYGTISIRWYAIFFALAFIIGLFIVQKIFNHEKLDDSWADIYLVYIFIGTLIGARLGHVFFYDWSFYSIHPGEIYKIWRGGLASHGAAIGIIIASWIFSKQFKLRSFLWIIDRLTPAAACGALLIRLGNLMNSEIIGKFAEVPWAFIFTRVDNIPRHPTQVYECLTYFFIAILLLTIYFIYGNKKNEGLLSGLFFFTVFLSRFLIEFVKESQHISIGFLQFNVGQLLSIPFIILGIYLISISIRKELFAVFCSFKSRFNFYEQS